jgi:hypothetical protein
MQFKNETEDILNLPVDGYNIWRTYRTIRMNVTVLGPCWHIRGRIQKFPDWVDNEIYAYLWYYSLRSNTNVYGGKTHWTDSQNRDKTAPSDRDLYHLQFSLQAVSPETFGYTLVHARLVQISFNYM